MTGSEPGRMGDVELLHILHALTSQKTAIKLTEEFKGLVESFMPGSRIEVFEVRAIRDLDPDKADITVILDSLAPEREAVDMSRLEGVREALESKDIVNLIRGDGRRMIVPLAVSAVSHIVVFDHRCADEAAMAPLFYSFGNLLELLRSRDSDPLTGFLNRYAFNRSMGEMELNSPDNPGFAADGRPYRAIAMLDLDHFYQR